MKPADEILFDWWKATGDLPCHSSDGEAVIERIEQHYDLRLPDDFCAYLRNRIPDEDFWDEHTGIWWAPDRLKNIPDEYDHPISNMEIAAKAAKYIFFADYCIWFWAWAICCEEGENYGKIAIISGEDRFVANSFAEFVAVYVEDPLLMS